MPGFQPASANAYRSVCHDIRLGGSGDFFGYLLNLAAKRFEVGRIQRNFQVLCARGHFEHFADQIDFNLRLLHISRRITRSAIRAAKFTVLCSQCRNHACRASDSSVTTFSKAGNSVSIRLPTFSSITFSTARSARLPPLFFRPPADRLGLTLGLGDNLGCLDLHIVDVAAGVLCHVFKIEGDRQRSCGRRVWI